MSDYVIKVENLGKSYQIRHKQERYTALRDVLTDGAKNVGKGLLRRGNSQDNGTREEFWALNDVSFEVKRGERLGVIGRNGAGKSTLLKVLSRITEPTRGEVRLRGRVASLLEVGTGFHPELTGRENIYLNGAILGMAKTEIDRKFDEIVAFAEVERFLDTPVKRYSSGMYVRLAFAVAAHLESEILLVDEVLAVGDMAFQKKCLGQMEQISDSGRTVLFVSHNMAAIQRLCQRVILFDNGQIIEDDHKDHVINRYMMLNVVKQKGKFEPKDRGGRGWARITDVRLIDNEGNSVQSLPNDSDFILEIDVSVSDTTPSEITLRGLILEVMFYDEQAQPLFSSMSVDFNGEALPAQRQCTVTMRLPSPTFMPGIYHLNLFLGVPYQQHVDEIRNAFAFEILPPHVPWRPYDLHTKWGHLCQKADWTIEI